MDFVQENQLFSKHANTVRGFHYQGPPYPQGKLVKVLSGAILDFALDIRTGSPTYGQLCQMELSAANGFQLWLPAGFAHGFITLTPDTYVLNKLTHVYHPATEGGIAWDDPDVAAPWPLLGQSPIVSARDANGAAFADLVSPFVYHAGRKARAALNSKTDVPRARELLDKGSGYGVHLQSTENRSVERSV